VLPSSRTAEQKQKQKQEKAVEQADDCMAKCNFMRKLQI